MNLSTLSTEALTRRIADVLERERASVVEFVFLLVELRKRGAHLDLGYNSLFAYCVDALHLERSGAYRRSVAAEMIIRFPAIGPIFAERRIRLSSLVPLDRILTEANHKDVLARAEGLTREEVERFVGSYLATPVKADVTRRLPSRAASSPAAAAPAAEGPPPDAAQTTSASLGPEVLSAAPPRSRVEPINLDWTRIAFSANADFMSELEETRSALSHVVPDGNFEALFRECMRLAREACARRRLGGPATSFTVKLTDITDAPAAVGAPTAAPAAAAIGANSPAPSSLTCPGTDPSFTVKLPATTGAEATATRPLPGKSEASPGFTVKPDSEESTASFTVKPPESDLAGADRSRYIPVEVRRAVWERDAGCCSWVGPTGHHCGSKHQLEFDHIVPFALGGEATVEQVRLLCRAHNRRWAQLTLGEQLMAQYARRH